MRYAVDECGSRIEINDAIRTSKYYCPACGAPMIIKRGEIVAHHYAHKPGSLCDPYYSDSKSPWHREMQNMFPVDTQECCVWNADKSEMHIADVLIHHGARRIVFEFQYSPISPVEFRTRTSFYVDQGYHVVWVFNFATIDTPKRIYYRNKSNLRPDVRNFVWPGRDYVALFDGCEMWNYLSDYQCNDGPTLTVMFFVDAGLGYQYELQHKGRPYYQWDYDYPQGREMLYLLPEFKVVDWKLADSDEEDLKYFKAKCLTEIEYQDIVESLCKAYESDRAMGLNGKVIP